MSADRRTPRDRRRRELGQNFLRADLADLLIAEAHIEPGELVIDIGAGSGALTLACARRRARVIALEIDAAWALRLRNRAERDQLESIRVINADVLEWPWPATQFRVVGCIPFALTTAILHRLLDDPAIAMYRADLITQAEVATKRAAVPPATLLSTVWAPWWRFERGRFVPATAFRPVPRVDAAVLTIERRTPALLPLAMAGKYAEFVRGSWPFRGGG